MGVRVRTVSAVFMLWQMAATPVAGTHLQTGLIGRWDQPLVPIAKRDKTERGNL